MPSPIKKIKKPEKPVPTPKGNPNQKEYYVKPLSQNDTLLSKNNKTTKPSTRTEKQPILVCDTYRDLFTFRQQPISEAFIERLAQDFVSWAINNEDAIILSDFPISMGIAPRTFDRWAAKHDALKFAKETVLQVIGNRRQRNGLKNKFNPSLVMTSMALYDEEWDNLEKLRNERKIAAQKNQPSDVKYTIVVDSYKDTPETK